MSTHRSFHNHTHNHSSPNYNGNHQQHLYNPPNYESSRLHDHNIHDNRHAIDSSVAELEDIARQLSNRNSISPSVAELEDIARQLSNRNSISPSQRSRLRAMYEYLNDMYDHDHEKKEDDDGDVLKYLKIRAHHTSAKDGIDHEVVVIDETSEICAICLSAYEHEENIGALQCGHEYHTDCVKQWLLKKKECPLCRASILPSQK